MGPLDKNKGMTPGSTGDKTAGTQSSQGPNEIPGLTESQQANLHTPYPEEARKPLNKTELKSLFKKTEKAREEILEGENRVHLKFQKELFRLFEGKEITSLNEENKKEFDKKLVEIFRLSKFKPEIEAKNSKKISFRISSFIKIINGDIKLDKKAKDDLKAKIDEFRRNAVEEIQRLRHKIVKANFEYSAFDKNRNDPYLQRAHIQEFVKDTETGDYLRTRRIFDEEPVNYILSFFQIPYNQDLKSESLEMISYTEDAISSRMKKDFPSNAVAAVNLETTFGFANELAVALFAENFVTSNDSDHQSRAYYFTEKFVDRINNYSVNALYHHLGEGVFKEIKAAGYDAKKGFEKLKMAIAGWLSFHEACHRRGTLPRIVCDRHPAPDGLSERQLQNREYGYDLTDTKDIGALEEIRVDLLGLITASDPQKYKNYYDNDVGPIVRDLILSERLLRYPVMGDPDDNFDAISSHVLLNYLLSKDAIKIENNILDIPSEENFLAAITEMYNEIEDLFVKVSNDYELWHEDQLKAAQAELTKFVHKWSKYDHEEKSYPLDKFYKAIRETNAKIQKGKLAASPLHFGKKSKRQFLGKSINRVLKSLTRKS